MRGGVLRYAAQENPKIDAAKAEKDPFRMETRLNARKSQSLMGLGNSLLNSWFVVLIISQIRFVHGMEQSRLSNRHSHYERDLFYENFRK